LLSAAFAREEFLEPKMSNPSSEKRRQSDLDNTVWEPITEVEGLQKDMLQVLQRSSVDPISYVGLEYCGPKRCRRIGCAEACWYGTRRRLRSEIQAICQLLAKTDQPLYEVRIIPGTWATPVGELDRFDIAAVKGLNSRALNKLYKPSLIAVGNVKAAIAPTNHDKYGDRLWVCELHEIITDAEEAELKAAFSRLREGGAFSNKIWVKKVEDLGECINRVFLRDLQPWQQPGLQPWQPKPAPLRPTKAEQTEFYKWLLGLSPGARTIRYGCDRYFSPLDKKPRRVRASKKRKYPHHLKPYMFGYDPDDDLEISRR
jgi:hypothetical protein